MTMHHIASTVITTDNTEPAFTSIPQNFTHLQLRIVGRSPATNTGGYSTTFDWSYMRFNGVANAASYSDHRTLSDGSSPSFTSDVNGTTAMRCGIMPSNSATTGNFGHTIVDIFNYSSSTMNKVIRSISGCDRNGSGIIQFASGLFSDTTPISTIFLGGWSSGYLAGSRFDLYGITSNPVATGA